MKKYIVIGATVYILLGIVYGMNGEMRLAKKYSNSSYSALINPTAYFRATIFAPVWPIFFYWTLYNSYSH